ncbi:MAG TPA: sialate O-acetylesterase [Terriglobia bacterium]|nr:sialate O-acetylesterase [Terriglobia bacterium]
MRVLLPVAYQVTQRVAYDPLRADQHEPGSPALGFGSVHIELDLPNAANGMFQFRTDLLSDAFGKAVDWTKLRVTRTGSRYDGIAELPAGGWYRIDVRVVEDNKVVAEASVEPIGVGEVFVIAGQSYAAGYSDALTQIEDPQGRVVAYDVDKKTWRVANDPQPNVGPGGTVWPSMCNALLPVIQVPIGLINVAVDATSSRKWLPGGKLYEDFATAGKTVGSFRFVLWQQGESDVLEKVPTDTYFNNLVRIRAGLLNEWAFEPPWLLAKSTLHPMVYNDPTHEGYIRAAIDRLWNTPGFRPGPDTDVLGGENRGGPHSRRHFSELGQRRAGLMWFAAVWNELQRSDYPSPHE